MFFGEAPKMTRILNELYADYGITRLGEGGMVSNVRLRWLGTQRCREAWGVETALFGA